MAGRLVADFAQGVNADVWLLSSGRKHCVVDPGRQAGRPRPHGLWTRRSSPRSWKRSRSTGASRRCSRPIPVGQRRRRAGRRSPGRRSRCAHGQPPEAVRERLPRCTRGTANDPGGAAALPLQHRKRSRRGCRRARPRPGRQHRPARRPRPGRRHRPARRSRSRRQVRPRRWPPAPRRPARRPRWPPALRQAARPLSASPPRRVPAAVDQKHSNLAAGRARHWGCVALAEPGLG